MLIVSLASGASVHEYMEMDEQPVQRGSLFTSTHQMTSLIISSDNYLNHDIWWVPMYVTMGIQLPMNGFGMDNYVPGQTFLVGKHAYDLLQLVGSEKLANL